MDLRPVLPDLLSAHLPEDSVSQQLSSSGRLTGS